MRGCNVPRFTPVVTFGIGKTNHSRTRRSIGLPSTHREKEKRLVASNAFYLFIMDALHDSPIPFPNVRFGADDGIEQNLSAMLQQAGYGLRDEHGLNV